MKSQFKALTSLLVVAALGLAACQPRAVEGKIVRSETDIKFTEKGTLLGEDCFRHICINDDGTLKGNFTPPGWSFSRYYPSSDGKSLLYFNWAGNGWGGPLKDPENVSVAMCDYEVTDFKTTKKEVELNHLIGEEPKKVLVDEYSGHVIEECVTDTISTREFPDRYEPLPAKYRK